MLYSQNLNEEKAEDGQKKKFELTGNWFKSTHSSIRVSKFTTVSKLFTLSLQASPLIMEILLELAVFLVMIFETSIIVFPTNFVF